MSLESSFSAQSNPRKLQILAAAFTGTLLFLTTPCVEQSARNEDRRLQNWRRDVPRRNQESPRVVHDIWLDLPILTVTPRTGFTRHYAKKDDAGVGAEGGHAEILEGAPVIIRGPCFFVCD